jgi:hypothetical protein
VVYGKFKKQLDMEIPTVHTRDYYSFFADQFPASQAILQLIDHEKKRLCFLFTTKTQRELLRISLTD